MCVDTSWHSETPDNAPTNTLLIYDNCQVREAGQWPHYGTLHLVSNFVMLLSLSFNWYFACPDLCPQLRLLIMDEWKMVRWRRGKREGQTPNFQRYYHIRKNWKCGADRIEIIDCKNTAVFHFLPLMKLWLNNKLSSDNVIFSRNKVGEMWQRQNYWRLKFLSFLARFQV